MIFTLFIVGLPTLFASLGIPVMMQTRFSSVSPLSHLPCCHALLSRSRCCLFVSLHSATLSSIITDLSLSNEINIYLMIIIARHVSPFLSPRCCLCITAFRLMVESLCISRTPAAFSLFVSLFVANWYLKLLMLALELSISLYVLLRHESS